MTQFKVLLYVDNEPTSMSGKVYDDISSALKASESWSGHLRALFESVVAIANVESGEIVSRTRIRQSAERREELWEANEQ